MTDDRFWPRRSFAALPAEHTGYRTARVVILPVPYDSTASGWVGAREGPAAIIETSENMELYDIDIGREPYRVGIHTLPELAAHAAGPEAMVGRIEEVVRAYAAENCLSLVLRFGRDPVDQSNPDSVLKHLNRPVVYYDGTCDITDAVIKRIKENEPKDPI